MQLNISSKVVCDVEESYEVEKRPGIDNQGILHRWSNGMAPTMPKMAEGNGYDPGHENVFQSAKHFRRDF